MGEPSSSNQKLFAKAADLQHGRKQFRAPFKVHVYEWNPKSELLALGSRKGEVLVKRPGWKKCWKINVSSVVDAFTEADADDPRSVESLGWDPTGEVLAVGMSDGHVHLVDVAQGTVRWSRLIIDGGCPLSVVKLRWFFHREGTANYGHCFDSGIPEEERGMARMGNDRDERLASVFMLEELYTRTLRGTLLFAIRDDRKISIMAAGVMQIAVIDLDAVCESLNLMTVLIYDVYYSHALGGVAVVTTNTGPRPHCGGTGSFGVPISPKGALNHPHTHVINVRFKIDEFMRFWQLVERYIKLHHRYLNMDYSLQAITKEWTTQVQIFTNRLQSPGKGLDVGQVLLGNLMCGPNVCGPVPESWMERTLAQGITGMREFLDGVFSGLIIKMRDQLGSAVRSFTFHLEQYQQQVEEYMETQIEDYESLLFPEKNQDVNVYPFDCRLAESSKPLSKFVTKSKEVCLEINEICKLIQMKTNQAILAATMNLRELQALVRWMSLYPALLRSNRRNGASIHQSVRVDMPKLIKYIIETFISSGADRDYLIKGAFQIDKILEDMRKEEAEPGYVEEYYMRDKRFIKVYVKLLIQQGLCSPEDNATLEAEMRARLYNVNREGIPLRGRPTEQLPPNNEMPVTGEEAGESVVVHDIVMDEVVNEAVPFEPEVIDLEAEIAEVENFKPAIDKISDFWVEGGLSDATLKMLGGRNSFEGNDEHERMSFMSALQQANRVVIDAGEIVELIEKADKVEWIYEMESMPGHTGFSNVSIDAWKWSYNPADTDSDSMVWHGASSREEKVVAFHSKYEHDMRNAISMVAYSSTRCVMHTVLPANTKHLYSGLQEDLILELTTGQQLEQLVDSAVESKPVEGGLTIQIPSEITNQGVITEICEAQLHLDGYLYVTVKTNSEETGDMRRLLKAHPLTKTWKIHEIPLRVDQMESIRISGKRGCCLTDDSMGVALFHTRPPEVVSPTVRQREVEEYRRMAAERELANRPTEPTYFHVYDGNKVMRVAADDDFAI